MRFISFCCCWFSFLFAKEFRYIPHLIISHVDLVCAWFWTNYFTFEIETQKKMALQQRNYNEIYDSEIYDDQRSATISSDEVPPQSSYWPPFLWLFETLHGSAEFHQIYMAFFESSSIVLLAFRMSHKQIARIC